MSWSELRAYLGPKFRPEWIGNCEQLRPVVRAELAGSASLDEFYHTCHSYLYDLTAYELSGDKARNHALLERLVPAPATVLEYGCGIGADGLRLLERGYHVHFADLRNPSVEYLHWRLQRRGLEAPIYDVEQDTLPRVDVAICWDVLEHVNDPEAVLRRLESLADLVIVNFIQHDVDKDQSKPLHRRMDVPSLLAGIQERYPVVAIDPPEATPDWQVFTVAYTPAPTRPGLDDRLTLLDLSSIRSISEAVTGCGAETIWLLEGGEPNEAAARWHASFHHRRLHRRAVAAGPTWPCGGGLNLSVKKSFLHSALQQAGLDTVPVDAATVEAALFQAGAETECLPAAMVRQLRLALPVLPSDPRVRALWLGTAAGRAAAQGRELPARVGGLSVTDREASVLVVGEGDDPCPLLQRLAALATEWSEEWELVLVSQYGSACETAALYLEGDFRLIRNPEPVGFEVALNQAALAARGRRLIIPTAAGPISVPRDSFLIGGGAAGLHEPELHVDFPGQGAPEPGRMPAGTR